jgi:triacylglycerol lipase
MESDTSWDALSNPGKATDYFQLSASAPLQTGVQCFTTSNAWWLAEITRLSYHPDYHNKPGIKLGCLNYEKIATIDNYKTSTHVSLLKVQSIDTDNKPNSCLVIAFRGTDDLTDWNTNLQTIQKPFGNIGKVHSGFKEAYLSIKKDLFRYLNDYSLPIFVTGHSLGAALATLTTLDVYKSDYFDSCYTFGSPRTGNPDFVNSIICNQIYRVVNNCDIVTVVPLDFPLIKYKHIGKSYLLDDHSNLVNDMSEEEIIDYQKSKAHGLKEYVTSQVISKNIKQIQNKLPFFLSDHAPINYVLKLQSLLQVNPY